MKQIQIKQGGGGHNSQHFGCFASKIVGILNSSNQPKAKAFTLSEVLITLVIIGIVAALTIPSVVISYQKHQTVTRLKKTYSVLAQTTNKAIAEHGPIKNWETDGTGVDVKKVVDKYIAPYLNVSKNCGYRYDNECEFRWAVLNNPGSSWVWNANYYKLILSDGTLLFFQLTNDTKTYEGETVPRSNVAVLIDVNGKKGPNIFGKDIFYYVYFIKWDYTKFGYGDYSGTFHPNGGVNHDRETYKSNCSKTGQGTYCAALIMVDGWQMKDDYPW